MHSTQRPGLAKYIATTSSTQSSRKSKGFIDLVELCRRLIAEWQYLDGKLTGRLLSYEKNVAPERGVPEVANVIAKVVSGMGVSICPLEELWVQMSLVDTPISRLELEINDLMEQVTRKSFYAGGNPGKNGRQMLYWIMRMRYSCAVLNQTVGQLIPKFKKLKYDGFLLPNGRMVAFDSMNFVLLDVVPKAYHLFHFKTASNPELYVKIAQSQPKFSRECDSEVVETPMRIGLDGPLVSHAAMCFNLPEGDAGRLYVVDQSCSQFGVEGPDGGLVYYGYWDDYVKVIAKKVIISQYATNEYTDFSFYAGGPDLIKNVLKCWDLPSCQYCGEVESPKPRQKGEGIISLKKCASCKTVWYCDVYCQKLAWRGHKVVCQGKKNERDAAA